MTDREQARRETATAIMAALLPPYLNAHRSPHDATSVAGELREAANYSCLAADILLDELDSTASKETPPV